MRTVNEVSKLTGVSIRTLQYYDRIGLLRPAAYTEAGYRLYDDANLEQLQQILLFRELEFPLKEIKEIVSLPDFDRNKALTQQIALLTMKKEHLEHLITFARGMQGIGVRTMDFSAFDTKKLDEYSRRAKEQWGQSAQYRESQEKAKGRTGEQEQSITESFMQLFAEFGQMKELEPACERVQDQVRRLQAFISEHFYQCSDEILACLGQMYAGGGEMTENIDSVGGAGTAVFTAEAVRSYCENNRIPREKEEADSASHSKGV